MERAGKPPISAAFQGLVALTLMRQEVGAGRPQKRSEAAARGVRAGQVAPFEQIGEEPLNEVAGIVGAKPPPAHERVQGIPVIAAEPLEGGRASGSDGSPACVKPGSSKLSGSGPNRGS